MVSPGIGAKLRQERVGRGVTIDEIAHETRIASRFLEAIEADDFDSLPGLIFARNFVRQFALSLHLDPEPLLDALPKQDESTVQLPDPPVQPRRLSYRGDRISSALSSVIWLVLAGGAATMAWLHFNHTRTSAPLRQTAVNAASSAPPPAPAPPKSAAPASSSQPVQVVITAHQPAWVQVSADGKNAFTGTLKPDETKQISAIEKVELIAGNAGGLTVSLNGRTLEPLGPVGQVRTVMLTAEGPELLSKAPPRATDPL